MKNNLILFLLGSLCNLAFAPFELMPVLLVSFPLFLVYLNEATTNRQAFWRGWWFGFGYFVFGIYWIANSLLIDAEKFAWLIPFAVAGLPSILAIYIGLVGYVYKRLQTKLNLNMVWQVVIFVNIWVALEFARSYLFSGFPWNLVGYSSLISLQFAQLASLGSVYLLSWLVLWIAFIPMLWKKCVYTYIAIIAAVLLLPLLDVNLEYESYKMRVVQPNIEQKMKWDDRTQHQNFMGVLKLVTQGDKDQFDAIILPESAVTYHLNRDEWARNKLAEAVPKDGVIVAGSVRSQGSTREDFKIWNSLFVINGAGELESTYDKHHLVPFGEYVPLRSILPLEKITHGSIDFSSGENIGAMQLNKKKPNSLTFNPLICYEIIFPDYGFSQNGYDFILNITNDAWFGESSGPYQHLAMAQMRAIEQGVTVVRAANTGISAVIDSKGNIIDSIGLNERGVMDFEVKNLNKNYQPKAAIYSYLIVFLLIIGTSVRALFLRNN